jgi:S1-C subfamily serine protease
MAKKPDWEIPLLAQPKPEDFDFDLDRALQAIVGLQATIPEDAFTAPTLQTERAGSGVLIREDGLVVTIGYLITEAESVWLSTADGRAVPGHALAYDQETGFGLVQALGRLDLPALELGRSSDLRTGDPVIVAGGGRRQSVRAHVIGRQEFAGHWEYLLNEAIFTAPAHPFWGGTGLIGADGRLLGIGSLHVQQVTERGTPRDINMIVPIDILKPILDDLVTLGTRSTPARPWLGMFSEENDGRITVRRVADNGPAAHAGMREGDVIWAVRDQSVTSLADFYRKVWASGSAGTEIPIEVVRDSRTVWVRVKSADRRSFLKRPRLQ